MYTDKYYTQVMSRVQTTNSYRSNLINLFKMPLFFIWLVLLFPLTALADISDFPGPNTPLYASLYGNLDLFGLYSGLPTADPRTLISHLIQLGLSFVALIFLLLILLAGLQWMLAGGDEEKVAKAKQTLLNAIIGVVIIIFSYSIVNFVIGSITSIGGSSESSSTL